MMSYGSISIILWYLLAHHCTNVWRLKPFLFLSVNRSEMDDQRGEQGHHEKRL